MLSELALETEYRSDQHDLINEFYVPCLNESVLYCRAVGYFTSKGLVRAVHGLKALLETGGKMQLVASPHLSEKDIEAINKGIEAREDVILKNLINDLHNPYDKRVVNQYGILSWLLSQNKLEIKLAIPVDEQGHVKNGIYHEKLGLFYDEAENCVAFSGSANETEGGLIENFECSDVFWSWDDPQGRVPKKITNFNSLWDGNTKGLDICDFPDGAKDILLAYQYNQSSSVIKKGHKSNHPCHSLWEHQSKAIAVFLGKKHAVLEMATGTGKTRIALCIVNKLIEEGRVSSVIIATDGNDLLDQWYINILETINDLSDKYVVYRHFEKHKQRDNYILDSKNKILLVSRRYLDKPLKKLSEQEKEGMLLIHDEVHKLGSPSNVLSLDGCANEVGYRLGLSATPEREYDDEGNEFITEHIGNVEYIYQLSDAIKDKILTPFKYHQIYYQASEEDKSRLQNVYKKKAARQKQGNPMSKEELWIELARVYKTSKVKVQIFREFIANHFELLKNCIIFVETKEYGMEVLSIVHEYSHKFHTYFDSDEKDVLKRFGRGEIECLLTCHRISEGIDIRSLNTVILFSAARARLETIQRIGRCIRVDPNNPSKVANIIDFVRCEDGDIQEPDLSRSEWLGSVADSSEAYGIC